jgi:hypothetical protein
MSCEPLNLALYLPLEVIIGRVGSGFGSDQFDLLKEIGSCRIGLLSSRVGSIYMLCFFTSLIDFNWTKGHLILNWVRSSQVQIGSN